MSLLFSSQAAGSFKKHGAAPSKSPTSLKAQIRDYLKWALTPKPKPVAVPAASRPASPRPHGGRS